VYLGSVQAANTVTSGAVSTLVFELQDPPPLGDTCSVVLDPKKRLRQVYGVNDDDAAAAFRPPPHMDPRPEPQRVLGAPWREDDKNAVAYHMNPSFVGQEEDDVRPCSMLVMGHHSLPLRSVLVPPSYLPLH
jgi:hypothetical protein